MLIFFPFPDKSNFCFVRGCTFFGSHGGTRREKFTIKTKVDDNKHETTTIEHKKVLCASVGKCVTGWVASKNHFHMSSSAD